LGDIVDQALLVLSRQGMNLREQTAIQQRVAHSVGHDHGFTDLTIGFIAIFHYIVSLQFSTFNFQLL
jgi:hypothetical protein